MAEGGPGLPVPEPCSLPRALLAPERLLSPLGWTVLLGPGGAQVSEDPAPPARSGHSSQHAHRGPWALEAPGLGVVRPFPEAHGLFEPPCGPLRGLPCHRPDGGASGQCEGFSPAQPMLPALPQALVTTPFCPLPELLWAGPRGFTRSFLDTAALLHQPALYLQT